MCNYHRSFVCVWSIKYNIAHTVCHTLFISVWWKNVNKSIHANAHDTVYTHIHTRFIFSSLSNVFSPFEKFVFEHPYTVTLSVCVGFSPTIYFRTTNWVEKRRPCTWVKDKQCVVYVWVFVCIHDNTLTHSNHFQTKTKQSNTCSK